MTNGIVAQKLAFAPSKKPTKTRRSGAGKPKPDPALPKHYALDIGRNISLELTLAQYGIAPNATTVQRLGGAL